MSLAGSIGKGRKEQVGRSTESVRTVNIRLRRRAAHNKTLPTTLTPYSILLTLSRPARGRGAWLRDGRRNIHSCLMVGAPSGGEDGAAEGRFRNRTRMAL